MLGLEGTSQLDVAQVAVVGQPGVGRVGDLDLTPWPTKTAKARFLKRFAALSPK